MTHTRLLVEKKGETLKQGLLALGDLVDVSLLKSLNALRRQDLVLAKEVVAEDAAINVERRILEQEALLVLAAYQPAGRDLRMIGASMEIIAELERIADHAADVARILLREEHGPLPQAFTDCIADMGEQARGMVRDALTAYERDGDEVLARTTAAQDDEVDALQGKAINAIVAAIRSNPDEAAAGVALSWVAHNYERVADRATNIAERVVYIATGETPELN
jgi:phosphate transport system protein